MLKIFTVALMFALLAACDDIRQENYPSGKIRIQTQYVNDKKNGQGYFGQRMMLVQISNIITSLI